MALKVNQGRNPQWLLDAVSGDILDCNVRATQLCRWRPRSTTRRFDDLAQLLEVDSARRKAVTLAQLVKATEDSRKGSPLMAMFSAPNGKQRRVLLEAFPLQFRMSGPSLLLVAKIDSAKDDTTREAGALSAIIGHELNNIGMSLRGFSELFVQSMASLADMPYLNELRIAIKRTNSLAADLSNLGESESRPKRVPIAECLCDVDHEDLKGCIAIDWRCNRDIMVLADKPQAQCAIRSLALIATESRVHAISDMLIIGHGPTITAQCIVCGDSVSGKHRFVSVQVQSARPQSPELLRKPLLYGSTGCGMRRLTLAVLGHCAHCAGGHVLLAEDLHSLSVVLPIA
jgi:hypothetical protein